ncbi:MAG: sugar transferase [Bacteroidota bacterium]
MIKRLFDISLAIVAIAIFSIPLLIISALLIIKEKHAILFKQARIGKDKQVFNILKFQTLVEEVPTRTGKVLRRTGLDELPQFFNVLKGEMSIVGPRALTQADIERLGWTSPYHEARWQVKPGITGFAQIYGGQHKKTSWFWDKKYLNQHSLFVDFGIILISFLMNLFGKTKVRQVIFQKPHLQ